MVDYHTVRCTFAAVIIVIVYVQCISCKPAYIEGNGRRTDNAIGGTRRHLASLKATDPQVVATVKQRIKARMKGRRPDQSNERNLWTSHPKKEDWQGPDGTEEVYAVIASIGI